MNQYLIFNSGREPWRKPVPRLFSPLGSRASEPDSPSKPCVVSAGDQQLMANRKMILEIQPNEVYDFRNSFDSWNELKNGYNL